MLGESLKRAREDKKLSQADVAKKLNISRQSISKWENNRFFPTIENLIKLCKLYNVSLDELIKRANEDATSNDMLKNKLYYEFVAEY